MPREGGASSKRWAPRLIDTPVITGSSAFADDDTREIENLWRTLDGHASHRAALDPRRDQEPARSSRRLPRILEPSRARGAAQNALARRQDRQGAAARAQTVSVSGGFFSRSPPAGRGWRAT